MNEDKKEQIIIAIKIIKESVEKLETYNSANESAKNWIVGYCEGLLMNLEKDNEPR